MPEDEVLKLIGEYRPDLLIMFSTLPSGVPAVRKLIDYLREVNSCPQMQVMCCGGIYKRADGLSEEIGADLYAPDGAAVQVANANPARKATVDQQTVGRTRRIRKAAARKAAGAQAQTVPDLLGKRCRWRCRFRNGRGIKLPTPQQKRGAFHKAPRFFVLNSTVFIA